MSRYFKFPFTFPQIFVELFDNLYIYIYFKHLNVADFYL